MNPVEWSPLGCKGSGRTGRKQDREQAQLLPVEPVRTGSGRHFVYTEL